MRTRLDSIVVANANLLGPHHVSTSSIHLESVSTSSDEDSIHDLEPLLPKYHSASHSTSRLAKSRFSPLRIFLLLGFALLITSITLWSLSPYHFQRIDDRGSLEQTRQFLSNPSTENQGLIPFPSHYFSALQHTPSLPPTLSNSAFPTSQCVDEFVSRGSICEEMRGKWNNRDEQPKLDLIYTWTNGSSAEIMSSWKEEASTRTGRSRRDRLKRAVRLAGAKVFKHFREHDELRFSIRSAVAALTADSISTIHLIVGDSAQHVAGLLPEEITLLSTMSNQDFTSGKAAQIPRWINLSQVEFAESSTSQSATPSLRIHPHSELFKIAKSSAEEAQAWQDSVVPSFNSLAIESQLGNLETDSLTAVYLNDDFFLNEPLSVADFESPFTGPIFRMQRDLLVGGVDPAHEQSDPESEWKSLGTAAFLLDRRFGIRKRPYLVHVAKTVSTPMLKELQSVFLDELTQTAQARFRGRGLVEAQTMHLLAHYTIEKHREALLYSYLVLRSESSSAKFYSTSDRLNILSDLGSRAEDSILTTISVFAPIRSSLGSLSSHHSETGLQPPKEADIQFVSADGYAYFELDNLFSPLRGWPSFGLLKSKRQGKDLSEIIQDGDEVYVNKESQSALTNEEEAGEERPVCEIDLDSCFGSNFFNSAKDSPISVPDTFKRIAFEQPRCGDCLIVKLLGKSGETGLEAFLPRKEDSSVEDEVSNERVRVIGSKGTSWDDIDFEWEPSGNGTRRDFAISLIQRYSYAIAQSAAAFRSIQYGGEGLTSQLDALSFSDETHHPPAFLALNDDITTLRPSVLKDIDKRLGDWFRRVWNTPTKWELI